MNSIDFKLLWESGLSFDSPAVPFRLIVRRDSVPNKSFPAAETTCVAVRNASVSSLPSVRKQFSQTLWRKMRLQCIFFPSLVFVVDETQMT